MHKLKSYILAILCGLCFILTALASPVRYGVSTVLQPDGNNLPIITYGDEFYHISKTSDGCAVVKDLDGWWCYAIIDENGAKKSTGWHVGSNAPADVITASKNIPEISDKIKEKIATSRKLSCEAQPLMKRISSRQGAKAGNEITHKHGIVILAQFKDVKFRYRKSDFVELLTLKGYDYEGATGCAKDYFESQFGKDFIFDFDISNIITLSQNRGYYGANINGSDKAPEDMVVEACKQAAASGIDFSIYDQDNDGEVDNVFVFFAGEDEADFPSDILHSECIWSHAWYLNAANKDFILNGKVINRYACTSELARTGLSRTSLTGIGTFCHEYSHTLGLPDYYDTDYERSHGMSGAMWGSTALMDSGNQNHRGNTPPYFNALDREILGIGEPITISNNGSYTMAPIGENGNYYKIPTDNKDEYYLLECRAQKNWDKFIGGSGMLIYHIDKSKRSTGTSDVFNKELTAFERWFEFNEVNSYPQHQCADLVEADSRTDRFSNFEAFANSKAHIDGIFFPQPGITSFSATSEPAMMFWSGDTPKITISNIRKDGDHISFYVTGFEGVLPNITIEKEVIYQDEAIIYFNSDIPKEFAFVSWRETDKKWNYKHVASYAPGKYAVKISGLNPSTSYDVKIQILTTEGASKEAVTSFLTARYHPGARPYLSFKGTDRNEDGSFKAGCKIPLKVWNSVAAKHIEWYFNDKSISTEKEGFFNLDMNGTLKAIVHWEDGNTDVIVKEINIAR